MKVAVVTGSTRGIGKAIAELFAKQGMSVVINGRDPDEVRRCVDEIRSNGGQAIGIAADVTDKEAAGSLVNGAIKSFGSIDILVNNAGIIRDGLFVRMSEEEWKSVLEVHLNGVFYVTQAAVRQMKEQAAGSIINVTSLAGLEGVVGQANYATAKAGVLGLTWTLAKELSRYHIRVNAISPAALTDMTRPYVEAAMQRAQQEGKALPAYWQIGSPEDVAKVVGFLCSDKASAVTGQVIGVNGDKMTLYERPSAIPLTSLADLLKKY